MGRRLPLTRTVLELCSSSRTLVTETLQDLCLEAESTAATGFAMVMYPFTTDRLTVMRLSIWVGAPLTLSWKFHTQSAMRFRAASYRPMALSNWSKSPWGRDSMAQALAMAMGFCSANLLSTSLAQPKFAGTPLRTYWVNSYRSTKRHSHLPESSIIRFSEKMAPRLNSLNRAMRIKIQMIS